MSDLAAPDWSGPISTGLFGTTYAFGDGHSLVLISAPGDHLGSRPDRIWPWIHNHPSGDPTPSEDDLHVTRRLEEAGQTLGIQVLDHVIVGRAGAASIQEFRTRKE